MDYQGNYFPEEHDENESKIYRIVKKIFKWTMYGISFVIYALIFYILIINRDSKIIETNYFSELPQIGNVDTETMELYRINSRVFMNEDGSIQLHNIDYSDEYGLLEIGVKFNANKLTDGDHGDCLNYILTDSDGNTYPCVYLKTDSGGRYGFSRLCFTGIDFDLDSNDLRYDTEKSTEVRTNNIYKLAVTRKSDNELLYEFTIYDNSTTFSKTEYED